jgi:hypothetical protein
MPDAAERFGRLEVRMERVEEGIANFREFQVDARKFFTRADKDAEHRKEVDARRAKIHYLLLTLLIGMVLAMFTFILSKLPNIHISLNPHVSQSETSTIPPLK